MGISLERELEPLLAKLKQAAHAQFSKDEAHDPGGQADVQYGLKIFDSDLSTLITQFRGYYSLDGHDLDWQPITSRSNRISGRPRRGTPSTAPLHGPPAMSMTWKN